MYAVITWLLAVLLCGVVVSLWVPLVLEIAALVVGWVASSRKAPPGATGHESRFLFLVPAHNEEQLIGPCVASLMAVSYPPEKRRVVVVADNCDDRTGDLAEERGAECLRRNDPAKPGKPHAIRWALDRIADRSWDAVVIIDADTTIDPLFCSVLAKHAPLRDKVIQSYYGSMNEADNWLTRLAGVLARIRYERTYPIKEAAGLNCPLTGNGMVIGSGVLEQHGWNAFSLTENWELYADYTARGIGIRLVNDAVIHSQEARALGQGVTQRKRWLAGRLWVLKRYGLSVLGSRSIGLLQKADAITELAFPSPALQVALAGVVALAALLVRPLWVGGLIAALAISSLAGLGVHTIEVLRTHPEPKQVLKSFLMAPGYILWRCGVAMATLLTLGDRRWKKTNRH